MPDEREQIEDMERMLKEKQGNSPAIPKGDNIKHFDSPEEFEAWLAEQQSKLV